MNIKLIDDMNISLFIEYSGDCCHCRLQEHHLVIPESRPKHNLKVNAFSCDLKCYLKSQEGDSANDMIYYIVYVVHFTSLDFPSSSEDAVNFRCFNGTTLKCFALLCCLFDIHEVSNVCYFVFCFLTCT